MPDFKITQLHGENKTFFMISVGNFVVAKLAKTDIELLASVGEKVADLTRTPKGVYKNTYDTDDIVRKVSTMRAGGLQVHGFNVRSGAEEEDTWFEPHVTYTRNGEFIATLTLSMVEALSKEIANV